MYAWMGRAVAQEFLNDLAGTHANDVFAHVMCMLSAMSVVTFLDSSEHKDLVVCVSACIRMNDASETRMPCFRPVQLIWDAVVMCT